MTGSRGRPLALVIEDDLRYVRQLRADLASCGFSAVVAGTGTGGLDLCAREQADVVLLDLGLPDLEALAVLEGVRWRCESPVVAMTVAEDDAGIARALEAGADDYLPKPFDAELLLARLRGVLWRAPGTAAGSLLVFILAIGYYITPALVGGSSGQLFSNMIAFHMQTSLNWGLAAALGGILFLVVGALYVVYDRLVGATSLKLG